VGTFKRFGPSVAVALIMAVTSAVMAGCGGSSSTGGVAPGATQGTTQPTSGATAGSGPAGGACTLVTAQNLRSLGVAGPGSPQTVTRGTATVYGCTWGHPPANELHLQFERLDPQAASQVRQSLGGTGVVVPGVGHGARGQFGTVLAAVNFYKASTFASLALFGPAAGPRKNAFIAVAKQVASRL
jgi:hypothetical protein